MPDGPYIVTTKRQEVSARPGGQQLHQSISRRAVATLDDAPCPFCGAQGQPCIDGSFTMPLGADHEARKRLKAIPESGGAITLPDGTIIEVEATTWLRLGAGIMPSYVAIRAHNGDRDAQQRVLDAYNARQGVPSSS